MIKIKRCTIRRWNKRPIEDKLQERIAELEKAAVQWHKFPEEVPVSNGYGNVTLLVTYTDGTVTAVATCDYYFPMFLDMPADCNEQLGFGQLRENIKILAWAYMPAPMEGI